MTELAQAQQEADLQNRSIWHHTGDGDGGGHWIHPRNSSNLPLESYQAARVVVVEDGRNEMTITLSKPKTLVEVKDIFHKLRHRMAFYLRNGVITATII